MAKKKAVKSLTAEQYKQLGERMLKTGGNIYTVANIMFGVKGGDELFDGVKEHAGACKCEMCDQWKELAEMSKDMSGDVCEECVVADDMDD